MIALVPEVLLAYAQVGKRERRADTSAAMATRDRLGLRQSSDTPAPDGRDFLSGPIPSYLHNSDDGGLTERLATSVAAALDDRPNFWSELIAEGCAQIREFRDNAANQGRDSWWFGLGTLAFCEDGDQFAHSWGSKHPKYSAEETQRELDGWRRKADGATLCATFNRKAPGICERCPKWGKINSPIGLGIRQNPSHSMDGGPTNPSAGGGAAEGRTAEAHEQSNSGTDGQTYTAGGQAKAEREREKGQGGDGKNEAADGSAPGELKAVRGDELLSTAAPSRRWFVGRFVPASETTMLGGDGGAGKTTLALQLCVAGISGGKWIGLDVTHCNVLYVSAEDPRGEIHFRTRANHKTQETLKCGVDAFQAG